MRLVISCTRKLAVRKKAAPKKLTPEGELEPLPSDVTVRGVSKSVVSERFVVGTARKLAELMQRKLGGLRLIAAMIDGVHFADNAVLVAIGVDLGGKKHVLGLREGATEA